MQPQEQLQNISKLIIKKKILLNFVITNYTLKDKIFSWIHIILAIVAPILALSQEHNCDSSQNFSSVVISFIVASLIKVKDYVKYDKIRDVAKKQNILYKDLYDKIEIKNLSFRNSADNITSESMSERIRADLISFIKEIKKEYSNIEKNDPDIKDSDKEKYIAECKRLGIEYIDDIDELKRLIVESTPKHEKRQIKKVNINLPHAPQDQQDQQVTQDQDQQVTQDQQERDQQDQDQQVTQDQQERDSVYNNNKDLAWNFERLKAIS